MTRSSALCFRTLDSADCLDEIEKDPQAFKESSYTPYDSIDYIRNVAKYMKLWRRVSLSEFKDVNAEEWIETRDAALDLTCEEDIANFVKFRIERHDVIA